MDLSNAADCQSRRDFRRHHGRLLLRGVHQRMCHCSYGLPEAAPAVQVSGIALPNSAAAVVVPSRPYGRAWPCELADCCSTYAAPYYMKTKFKFAGYAFAMLVIRHRLLTTKHCSDAPHPRVGISILPVASRKCSKVHVAAPKRWVPCIYR